MTTDRDGTPAGEALSTRLRRERDLPWSTVKRLIRSGKVYVDGHRILDPGHRIATAQLVEVRENAPRPRSPSAEVKIVNEDRHLVVIDKPAGISTVPYEPAETGTAMDLIRSAWKRMGRRPSTTPLFVVHRIDKATSGLVVFAKSKAAERGLAAQFRDHSIERRYICVAHGRVRSRRIDSHLTRDRGDGLRGTARGGRTGKRAITHVRAIERAGPTTLCEVKLETGRTHQIRIHLAEGGNPLVGEPVYIRDYEAQGGPVVESPRLLLHAQTLAFVHPISGRPVATSSELPEDFVAVLDRLRRP